MILRGAKISIKKLLMFGLYACLILYVFFWDKLFINSRDMLIGMLACGLIYLLVSGRFRINASAIVFGLILIWTMGGFLLGGHFSYGSSLALAVAVSFLLFVLLQNFEQSFMPIILVMVLCSAVYAICVYIDMLSPTLMLSINKVFLKDGSLQTYKDLSSWGYYPGLTGFNCMSGFFLTLLLAFSLYKILFPDKKGTLLRSKYMVLAILTFLATVLIQKRSIFIASVLVVCFMILYSYLTKKRLKTFLAAFLLIGILFIGVYMFLASTASGAQFLSRFNNSDDISAGRFDKYALLLREWETFFVFGKGTGASRSVISDGAHNIYIQIFYDHGIVGLLLYLIWFALNLRYALRRFKKAEKASYEKCVLFISVFIQMIFLIYGVFGNPINDLYIFLLYVFFSGIIYAKQPMAGRDAQLRALQKSQRLRV